jgi:tetratricopeptide (TPR) repeat protein
MHRSLLLISALSACCLVFPALPAAGQESYPLPQLEAGADPRDPRAYYDHGIELIVEHPDSAAIAFYWASKLDPTWAEPMYARWVALHLTDRRRLYRYVRDDEDVIASPEIQRIDSLMYRALQLNPFFFRRLEYLWNETWWREAVRSEARVARYSDIRLNTILDSLLKVDTTAWVGAFSAYSNRRFTTALSNYAKLLNDEDFDRARVLTRRGQVFFLNRQYDSSYASFNQAIEELQQRDEDELVIVYESKAMLEYCAGVALESTHKRDAAREAYSRALVEDLSFYPAHERLGALAIAEGDTLTAVSEFELAAESDPTAIEPLLSLGGTLYALGRYEEATTYLQRAIEIEPYYADSYYVQGLVLEALGDKGGALSSFNTFVGLAKARDERHETVAAKIAELGGSRQ